jgi:hypothetical protein
MKAGCVLLGLVLTLSLAPALGGAEETATARAPRHRFGLGLQLSPASLPHGSAGIPVSGTAGDHVAVGITFRWQLLRWAALDFGAGLPLAALGLSAWAGFEPHWTLYEEPRGLIGIDLYAAPGLQLGFAGADYGARHSDAYVGFAYIYQGPVAFALRTPVGLRLRWWRSRFDTYAEALPIITFTPSVETLFGVAVGVRVNF